MKKKMLGIVMALVIVASLSACGAKTEEGNQESVQTEATEDGQIKDAEENAEAAEGDAAQESSATEESASQEAELDTSNSFIVYEVNDSMTGFGVGGLEFLELNEEVVTINDAQVVGGDGMPIGYIPKGTTITLTGRGPLEGTGSGLRQILNPVSEAEDKYLYLSSNDVVTAEEIAAMEEAAQTEQAGEDTAAAEIMTETESETEVVDNYEDREVWGYSFFEMDEEWNAHILQYEAAILASVEADKTYTQDEMQTAVINVLEACELTWDPELVELSKKDDINYRVTWGEWSLSTDGSKLQEQLFDILMRRHWGNGGIDFEQLYYTVLSEGDGEINVKMLFH